MTEPKAEMMPAQKGTAAKSEANPKAFSPDGLWPCCGVPMATREPWKSAPCKITHFDDGPVRAQHRRYFKRIPCQTIGEYLNDFTVEDADQPACECGVKVGELHHTECDMDECPVCGGQADGCGPGDHDWYMSK